MPAAPLLWLLLCALLPVVPMAALAQLSPNCERNGRRDPCALTPMPDPADPQQTIDTIVFADHTVYRVRRDRASCRSSAPRITTCAATIVIPAAARPLPALYRRIAVEGGYRHEYQGGGIRLLYMVLD